MLGGQWHPEEQHVVGQQTVQFDEERTSSQIVRCDPRGVCHLFVVGVHVREVTVQVQIR